MPTEDYGGQGAPRRKEGSFLLEYRYINRNGRWADKQKRFSDYDKALAEYNRIDNTAAIWDTTRMAELCVAKTRVAYYSVWAAARKQANTKRLLAIEASEPEAALAKLKRHLKGLPWVLQAETVAEVTKDDFNLLQPNNPWNS